MNHKYSLFLLVFAAFLASCDTLTNKDLLKKQENIYSKSIKNKDTRTALSAAYMILELDSAKANYNDSLASLYFLSGNYTAAYELAFKSRDTSSLEMKKILAYAAFQNKKFPDASLHFQDLIKIDKENTVIYEYEIGICFFNIENYQTTMIQMQKVIDNPLSKTLTKEIPVDNGVQEVPYYAAALNTAGFIYILTEDFKKAEDVYKALLKDYKGFALAENNYQYLETIRKTKK